MKLTKISSAISSKKGLGKVFIISIISVVVVLLIIGGIYLFYPSSSPFLKDYDAKFDVDELVEETNFSNLETKDYLTSPVSVLDMEFSSNKLYVLDTTNHRVMVFNPELESLKNIGEMYGRDGNLIVSAQKEVEAMLHYPGVISKDDNGNLFVIDRLNKKIKVYDSNDNYVRSIVIPDEIVLEFKIDDTPNLDATELSFEVLSNGNFVLHGLTNNKIVLLSPEMVVLKELTLSPGRAFNVRKSDQGIYVINDISKEILEYDNNLNSLGKLSVSLDSPYDLCLLDGKVVISDRGAGVLKVLNLGSGEVVIGDIGSIALPTFVACDSSANIVYVYDDASASLKKVDVSSFEVLGMIESNSNLKVKQGSPAYVAISPVNEDVAVSDSQNNVVMILDSSLEFKKMLGGKYGDAVDAFKFPSGVSYDSAGNLYIVDRLNRNIKVYDSNYNFVKSIENVGNNPLDIIISPNGEIIYVESTSHTVSMVNPEGVILTDVFKPVVISDYYNDLGAPIPEGKFVIVKGLGYRDGKYYVVDRVYPTDGSQYHVMINEFNSDKTWVKRYEMLISDNTGIVDTIGLYDSMAIIANGEENSLYFYDMAKEKVIDKLLLTHKLEWNYFSTEVSPDESYALVSNLKDGKLFKIDLKDRKIVDEKRIALYYETL